MAFSSRRSACVGVVVCCGVLAVPAVAPASHMSDMPWCPHSNEQGPDPAAQQPGAGGAGTSRAAPVVAPIGTTASSGAPAPASSAPSAARAPAGTASPGVVTQQAAVTNAVQQSVGVAAVSTTTTASGAVDVQLASGGTVVVRGPVTAEAVRRARARARAQRRLEASARAKALQAARAERARSVRGARIVAQVRTTTPIGWLAEPKADVTSGTALPAIGGALAALLALTGLGVAITRRRRGGTALAAVADGPTTRPTPDHAAAIEAELQEIIAEERAAREANERPTALCG